MARRMRRRHYAVAVATGATPPLAPPFAATPLSEIAT